jgi:hypothetical protein
VGNGSWAAHADESFTYETQFDWVRVYQKPEYTAISDVLTEDLNPAFAQDAEYYDLSGRKFENSPKNGVFIHNGKLVLR